MCIDIRSNRASLFVLVCWCVVSLTHSTSVTAAEANRLELDELLKMDLRELTNLKVSLASRVEEKQFQSPAAVYVITEEDIRRSGHRRLPEILRMVPGLHVAKIDANKWQVTSRNALSRFTSTMLVMIDGRHVYTPFYAGVYWESQDTFLEDIERIEVVRGPGGPLWGANAVDGIINIITKSAADTHGVKAYGLAGVGEMQYEAGVRFGSQNESKINYRVFAKGYRTDTGTYLGPNESTNNGLQPTGQDANDQGQAKQAGFRLDWNGGNDSYMLQGNVYQGRFDEDRIVGGLLAPNMLDTQGYNVVFNWKRRLADTESLVIQTFIDQISRDDDITLSDELTLDIDMQHSFVVSNHSIAWGLGYRYYENEAFIANLSSCGLATPCFGVDPTEKDLQTWSAFLQDRIGISDTFALILGSKFENNAYTDFEYQPTIRGLWTPGDDTTYWVAVTRAVRVPDRVNTDGILDFGGFTVPIGNKDQEAYIVYVYELGYRQRFSDSWLLDGTVFYNDYRNTIQGTDAGGTDDVYGFEGYIKYQFSKDLRLEMGYTLHQGHRELAVGGDEPLARLPRNSLHLRSYYNLKNDMELDALIYFVDESKSASGATDISDYTRFDLRYGWRPTRQWELSLLFSNMLDEVHAEGIDSFKINTGVKRGAMLKLTYTN